MWGNGTESEVGDERKFAKVSDELLEIQRFRIEKGKGVAYLLVAIMVLVTLIVYSLVSSLLLLIVFNTANGVVVWYAVMRTGFRGVRIKDYPTSSKEGELVYKRDNLPLFVAVGILINATWLMYIILSAFNYTFYAFFIPFIFSFEMLFPLFRYVGKQDQLLIGTKVADWAFFLSFAVAALTVLIPGFGALGFAIAIPVWIGSGLKSLYDASDLSSSSIPISISAIENTQEIAKKLSSMGPLAYSARVAILLVLERENKATFTEILMVTGMPKSSLKSSLTTLENAGMIISRVSLSSTDRPRTVLEITDKGRKAVREYARVFSRLSADSVQMDSKVLV